MNDATVPDERRRALGGEEPAVMEPRGAADDVGTTPSTVEELVRVQLAEQWGGWRGGLEVALPTAAFAPVHVVTGELRTSLIVGIGLALALLAVRLVQRSETKHVRIGLIGIAIGALLASTTGRGEDVFLPGIVIGGVWAALIAGSVLVRWPLVGFVIGGLLDDPEVMKHDPGIMRLANRLTLLLAATGVIRTGVQLPLYLAGEVGWLGVSRIVLGWPLTAAAFAVGVAILAKGHTPLYSAR